MFDAQPDRLAFSPGMSSALPTTPTQPAADARIAFATQHPCRMLVADDSAVNRKIIQRMFAQLGYEPVFAANGREAVDTLHLTKVDLVFMDVEMPVLDGIAATQAIRREIPPSSQPTIVGLTAHTADGTRERLLASGMNDYLPKPFTVQQLMDMILRFSR